MKKIYNNKWFPRLFYVKPDGGKDSGVTAYFLIEWKVLFSIGILHFKEGTREAYHNHAFNALTWWLNGSVLERHYSDSETTLYSLPTKKFKPSLKPKITKRDCFHKVIANKDTWALTFRGPWRDTWNEFKQNKLITLTHGRKII